MIAERHLTFVSFFLNWELSNIFVCIFNLKSFDRLVCLRFITKTDLRWDTVLSDDCRSKCDWKDWIWDWRTKKISKLMWINRERRGKRDWKKERVSMPTREWYVINVPHVKNSIWNINGQIKVLKAATE